ncbi:hypothetical protein TNCV_2394031 [Trichonephila clavipes]|nr:hypothetical protein TNCV_2394031 [Trichonephila clavipes]
MSSPRVRNENKNKIAKVPLSYSNRWKSRPSHPEVVADVSRLAYPTSGRKVRVWVSKQLVPTALPRYKSSEKKDNALSQSPFQGPWGRQGLCPVARSGPLLIISGWP